MKIFAVALIVPCLAFSSFAEEEAGGETGWYTGAAAQLVLPQGGSRMCPDAGKGSSFRYVHLG